MRNYYKNNSNLSGIKKKSKVQVKKNDMSTTNNVFVSASPYRDGANIASKR